MQVLPYNNQQIETLTKDKVFCDAVRTLTLQISPNVIIENGAKVKNNSNKTLTIVGAA